MVRAATTISESLLVKVWQCQLLDGNRLVTEDGEPLRVVYPGRVNGDRGADLLDAVIGTSRGVIKGDIEVHVRSSNWNAHRHHLDPAYNGVVLHVVFQHDSDTATSLQNGAMVPTVALDRYMRRGPGRPPSGAGIPCRRAAAHLDTGIIAGLLDDAGQERFLAKAAAFQEDLTQTGPAEALYRGIMGALGYAKNKLPCLELARRLPLRALHSAVPAGASAEECLAEHQARLLGTAGLLPSQRSGWRWTRRGDDWEDELEGRWASSRPAEAMSESDWHLFKVRPNNLPQRRLAAMSHLLLRYRQKGLLDGLMDGLRRLPVDSGWGLKTAVMVIAEGYWATHFDFSLPSRRPVPTLIGERRAADIAVNALLPFAFAWGKADSEPRLAGKAAELYRHHPGLAFNAVERHMRQQLGLDSRLVNSARRQQGLLHVYRTLCSQGECDRCPLATR